MAAELLSFFRPAASVNGDWSTQEIAEFYRVEAALVQAGMSIVVDRGISDEGDPWFVFCRAHDGEVIVHFARVEGKYLIVAESVGRALQGADFRRLLAEFVSINPTLIPMPPRGSKMLLHPSSLLAAVVATALYHMLGTEAVANTLDPGAVDDSYPNVHRGSDNPGELSAPYGDGERKWYDRQIAAAVAAMMALAATEFSQSTGDALNTLASALVDLTDNHLGTVHSVVAHAVPVRDTDTDLRNASLLDTSNAHARLDGISASSAAQTVIELKGNVAANVLPAISSQMVIADLPSSEAGHKSSSQSADGDHRSSSTDAVIGILNETQIAGADRSAVASSAPSSSSAASSTNAPSSSTASSSSDARLADRGHNSPPSGSSTPDHAPSSSIDFHSADTVVTNLLNNTNLEPSQVSLVDHLSVRDLILAGATDLFGTDVPKVLTGGLNLLSVDTLNTASEAQSTTASNAAATTVAPLANSTAANASATVAMAQQRPFAAFDSSASQLIDAFARQNTFEVLRSDHNYVLFDTDPTHFVSPDLVIKTWAMTDGSTISIIGLLPHDLAILV
jgi:hypothetical protein